MGFPKRHILATLADSALVAAKHYPQASASYSSSCGHARCIERNGIQAKQYWKLGKKEEIRSQYKGRSRTMAYLAMSCCSSFPWMLFTLSSSKDES